MCGFAGLVDISRTRRLDDLRVTARGMAECVRHRGPDDEGSWVDEGAGVAFGFQRLAIIDLSDAGHQPLVSHDRQLVIVFNGEIYNHEELRAAVSAETGEHYWSGHSDTETLLECFARWGVKRTLERAVGMFAFALWDRRARRLCLARDRFGKKPLYYGWTGNAFIFGSELKALRRCPGFDNAIDPDVLALYTQYAYVPAPYSIYRRIYKLQPACLLTIDDAGRPAERALFAPAREPGLMLERYWSLSDIARQGMANPAHDELEALEQLESTLADVVRLQSMADVPLGAFLSGGVDSSVIVALMQAQSSRKVKTFTIGFDEAGFNEAVYAKAVARHLGTEHEELYVSGQQARDVIPLLPDLYSEPFADSSQIPTHLVSRIARQHVTVALSGDGGDELFGGYTRYQWGPRIWNRLRPVPPLLRRAIGAVLQQVPVSGWNAMGDLLPGHRIARLGDKAHKLGARLARVSDLDSLYRVLVTTWPPDAGIVRGARPLPTVLDVRPIAPRLGDVEHEMMLRDGLTYLPDDILHKVDRASMGVSLETRAPFLDHRVAELAWRLPLRMKIRQGEGKWILRQLLYKHVPRGLIERPKMGFGVPIESWIRGPLRDWAEDLLAEAHLTRDGYLNPAPIRLKWAEHVSGARNWHHELWCVLMFQAWRAAAR